MRLKGLFPLSAYFAERTAGFVIGLLLRFAEHEIVFRQTGIRLDLDLLQFIK